MWADFQQILAFFLKSRAFKLCHPNGWNFEAEPSPTLTDWVAALRAFGSYDRSRRDVDAGEKDGGLRGAIPAGDMRPGMSMSMGLQLLRSQFAKHMRSMLKHVARGWGRIFLCCKSFWGLGGAIRQNGLQISRKFQSIVGSVHQLMPCRKWYMATQTWHKTVGTSEPKRGTKQSWHKTWHKTWLWSNEPTFFNRPEWFKWNYVTISKKLLYLKARILAIIATHS